jgi:mono/diheme cytochrome c family protein
MAATDQTYRRQRTLDVVFGVSCVLMLGSLIWMFAQDYYRPYKPEQRRYRDVEEGMAERQLLKLVPDGDKRGEIQKAQESVATARDNRDKVQRDVQEKNNRYLNDKNKLESDASKIKADYDSQVSIYDIAVAERNAEPESTPRHAQLAREADDVLARVNSLKKQLQDTQDQLDQTNFEIEKNKRALQEANDDVAKKEGTLKDLSADFERFAKLVAQKRWKTGDWFRSLPVLDAFATPTKIDQVTLNDLPINYNFRWVTRYDRCGTCHLGMVQPNYTKPSLRALRDEPSKDLLAWLNDGKDETALPENLKGEKLADDVARLKTARLMLKERQENLKDYSGASPSDLSWVSVHLSDAQIQEYAVHPRLDLFVDEKSPHPVLQYGCTVCHGGQGSATDFQLAAHTPTSSLQKGRWIAKQHWEENHDWEFPMLPKRFLESSCIKCHHQVVDLLPQGESYEFREDVSGKRDRVPSPGAKVVRGYNLVREFGCFGCHEIAGMKDGRAVGPDLRLEPNPPLEDLTPAERLKLTSDPANPPGTERKVGPSLRRLSEKTNEEWVKKWVYLPRGFRPETRMPHFYNVSNNSAEALAGTGQEAFPTAEVASIAYYLMRESEAYLKGDEISQRTDLIRQAELSDLKAHGTISKKQETELEEVKVRIKERSGHKPVPIAQRLIGEDGSVVQMPDAPKDAQGRQAQLQRGRQVFTERGCLACHSHDATTRAGEGLPKVVSDAHFGPDLSRLAAKIAPQTGGEEARRRWLVQWVLDPHVHSPRTKMPVTHLTPEQASDVAAWLLSQKADWKGPDVPEPGVDVLENLASVYLQRSMTRSELKELLANKGLKEDRIKDLRQRNPEADELRLNPADAEPWPQKLKWYIGRKAINNVGCFGCHDIPGFENAKPIGTPLNDWGKKDPDRLAFEDVVAYVKSHHAVDDRPVDDKGFGKVALDGKRPVYERYFLDALERHQRDGFLQQKLREPRSYDYERLRTWDDRLRMPQFRFTRGKAVPKVAKVGDEEVKETQAQADAREEADSRDAVMTFVLGLMADPIPAQYVYKPTGDRAAEVAGQHVLDKFNCAGCHQLRPGRYEFKATDPGLLTLLDTKYGKVRKGSLPSDFANAPGFAAHNAWHGVPSSRPDRLVIHALERRHDPRVPDDFNPRKAEADAKFDVRLTEAVRFTTPEHVHSTEGDSELTAGTFDIPAAESLQDLPRSAQLAQADKVGGTLADLLTPYLMARNPTLYKQDALGFQESGDARAALPPPLLREGERTQPAWLYQFLRNPYKIRPATVLRMPRFNMSPDEAMTLVAYFAAVDRLANPAAGLHYPYETIPQRDAGFLSEHSEKYARELGPEKLAARVHEFKQRPDKETPSVWQQMLRDRTEQVEEQLKGAEAALKSAQAEDRARLQKERDALKKSLDVLKDKSNKDEKEREKLVLGDWAKERVYATDAFRLVANKNLCFQCHQVGSMVPEKQTGPPLDDAPQRLRPEWTRLWIASPQRLLIYPISPHPMPQAFPNDNPTQYNDTFVGSPLDRATAVRDILMIYPRVADLPEDRYYRHGRGGNP